MRQLNADSLNLIREFEGEVLEGYKDAVGKLTIGVGHLVKAGEPYKLGQRITPAESERLLQSDLRSARAAVESSVEVPVSDNQFGALVSLAFNIGTAAFKKSTLLKMLNRGDYRGAADQFLLWNKGTVKGKKVVIRGLTRRREAERKLFLTNTFTEEARRDSAAPADTHTPFGEAAQPADEAGDTQTSLPPPTHTEEPLTEENAKAGEAAPDTTAEPGQPVVGGRPEDPSVRVTNSRMARIYAGAGAVLPVVGAVWGWINGNLDTVKLCILCVTLLGLALIFRNSVIDVVRLILKASPDKYNVR